MTPDAERLAEIRKRACLKENAEYYNNINIRRDVNFLLTHIETLQQEREQWIKDGPPADILEGWLKNELADLGTLIDHLSRTYEHFSGGRISKPMTFPEEVFAESEERESKWTDECVKEATEELREQVASLELVRKAMNKYLDFPCDTLKCALRVEDARHEREHPKEAP